MEEKKQPRIKILVACHKADPNIRQDDIYMPIQVGKALHPELDLGFQCDNTGDNISEKNGSYCELTALYWAWKNLKDVDYIGLCHYRRYFAKNRNYINLLRKDKLKPSDFIDANQVIKLQENEVILPTFWTMPQPINKVFANRVMEQDLYILYKIIKSKYPEYLPTYTSYMLGNRRTGYNMFLMSRVNFENYCSWMFDILKTAQNLVKGSQYTSYNRIYGYFGEILTAIYCIKNFKIKENTILFVDKDTKPIKLLRIKLFAINTLNSISYYSGRYWLKKSIEDPYWETYLKQDGIKI